MHYIERAILDDVGVEPICKLFGFKIEEGKLISPEGTYIAKLYNGVLKAVSDMSFLTGSLLDFLSFYEGNPSDALTKIYDEYDYVIDAAFPEGWAGSQATLVKHLDFNRAVLGCFIEASRNVNHNVSTNKYVKFIQGFSRGGVNIKRLNNYAFIFSPDLLSKLSRAMAIKKLKMAEYESYKVLVPYFENPYTIVGFEVFSNPDKSTFVELSKDASFGISNLWSYTSPKIKLSIAGDSITGFKHQQTNLETRLDSCTVGVHDKLLGIPKELPIKKFLANAVFLVGDSNGMDIGSRLVSHVPTLRASNKAALDPHKSSLPWKEYAVLSAVALYTSGRHEKAEQLMEDASFTTPMRNSVSEKVSIKLGPKAVKVNTKSSSKTRIYNIRKNEIHETSEGYKFKDTRTEASAIPITNFTLHFTDNVIFEGGEQTYHRGYMKFQGAEYPIMMSRDAIMTSRKIEKEAQLCYSAHVTSVTNSNVPFIIDHRAASNLTVMFNTGLSKLPATHGIVRIHKDKDKFTGVTIGTGEDGKLDVYTTERVLHPKTTTFIYYSPELPDLSKSIPIDGMDDFVDHVVRCLMGSENLSPKLIQLSKGAESFLTKFFKMLGQTTVYELSNNCRGLKQLPDLSNYPVLMKSDSLDEEELVHIELPGIIITPHGEALPFEEIEDAQIVYLFKQVLRKVNNL